MKLTELYIHPLKSARAIALSRAYADDTGLLHDREWLLTDPDGRFITARECPALLGIQVELIPGAALFRAPDTPLIAALSHEYRHPVECNVWKDRFAAWHGDARVDMWFSTVLGRPCRLVWLGTQSQRPQKGLQKPLSFADGYPYLLVNQASLDSLNQLLPNPVATRHFRPNLVIAGAGAYEEDDWTHLKIGGSVFEITKPCTRCVITTLDPDSGAPMPDGEPLRTLRRTRQSGDGICFGVNLRLLEGAGILNVGDDVQVVKGRYDFD